MPRNLITLKKMEINFSISEKREKEGVIIPILRHGDSLVWIQAGVEDISACDALITMNRNLSLGIATADCAPICFSDGEKIAIAHIGWRGLCLGLIEKVLTEINRDSIEIFVGPHLRVFEIQRDFCYEIITQKFGDKFFTYENSKIIFNFKDAIASLLPLQTIFDTRNTGYDLEIPSWRRNKTSKRLITVVQFKK